MAKALLLFLALLIPQAIAIREITQNRELEIRPERYLSNPELTRELLDFSRRCRKISRLYSIGKSVKGTPLWVLEISDKPGKAEPEPAFKIVGNMHGDEPLGRELIVRLSDWLCTNYPKDPLAKTIVENVHLHLLPSMNPDGFENQSRNNANDVDLNRDFPDQFIAQNNDERGRQPETLAVMNWIRRNHFVASASLHEGAVVANYPWDGSDDMRTKYSACADDLTFQYLASIYSRSHRNMSKSVEFPAGITNGAAWYPLYGGMQDWNYIHGHCMELTLEISENKWPPASQIPQLWEDNRQSLLNLIASVVKMGLHGRVQASGTGLPMAATILVQDYNQTVQAAPHFGDYHRLLVPGKPYKVSASFPGYRSRTTYVMVPEGEPATLDFILEPTLSMKEYRRRSSEGLPYHLRLTTLCFVPLGALTAIFCFGLKRAKLRGS